MTIRTKYQLPVCTALPDIKFDLIELKKEVDRLSAEWVNLFQANRGLCSNHPTLAENNYHHFDQINLTYFEPTLNKLLDLTELKNECRTLANSTELGDSAVKRFRTKITRAKNLIPAMNEHNWYHPLAIYEGSYIQKTIESQFKSSPIRVRLTRIRPGKELSPHIDYGPDYAVRIIVPIIGTDNVKNLFWNKGKIEEYHLAATGEAYIMNVGYKHAVQHEGTKDRLCLMFSLAGQEDLTGI